MLQHCSNVLIIAILHFKIPTAVIFAVLPKKQLIPIE